MSDETAQCCTGTIFLVVADNCIVRIVGDVTTVINVRNNVRNADNCIVRIVGDVTPVINVRNNVRNAESTAFFEPPLVKIKPPIIHDYIIKNEHAGRGKRKAQWREECKWYSKKGR